VIIDCTAPEAELRRRLRAREGDNRDASDATEAVLDKQLQHAQPLSPQEQAFSVPVVAAPDPGSLWQRVQAHCFDL